MIIPTKIDKHINYIVKLITSQLTITDDERTTMNKQLSNALKDILIYLKSDNTATDMITYDTLKADPELKEQIKQRYIKILNKYEDTTDNSLDKDNLAKQLVCYQLGYNVEFQEIKNIIMYAAFDDKTADELIEELTNLTV